MTTPLPTLNSPARIAELAPPRSSAAQTVAKASRTSFKDTLAEQAPVAGAPEAAPIAADEGVAQDARERTERTEPTEEARPRAAEGPDTAARGGETTDQAARQASDNPQTAPREAGEASTERAGAAPRPVASIPAQQAVITAQVAPGLPDIALPEPAAEGQASPPGGETAESTAQPARPAPTPSPAPAPVDAKLPAPAVVVASSSPIDMPVDASPAPADKIETGATPEKVENGPAPRVSSRGGDETASTSKPPPAIRPESAAPDALRPETSRPAAPTARTTRPQVGGLQADRVESSDSTKDAAGDRAAPRSSLAGTGEGRASPSPAPAAARAAQVNAAVQLENLAAQLSTGGGADGLSARSARATLVTGASLKADGAAPAGSLFAPHADGEPDFAGRIVRGLSAMVSQRGGVMTMRLHPPELGSLRVQMSIIQGAVSAQFTATTEHAQMLLERNLTTLQSALQSNGLTVEKLGVHLAGAESSTTTRQEADSQQQHHQQQGSEHDAAGRESRGRHDGERPTFRRHGAAPADFAASLSAPGAGETPFTGPTSLGAARS